MKLKLYVICVGIAALGGVLVGSAVASATNPNQLVWGYMSCSGIGSESLWRQPTETPKSVVSTWLISGNGDCEFDHSHWPWNGSQYVGYHTAAVWFTGGFSQWQNDFATTKVYGYHGARIYGSYSTTRETFAE